MYSGDLESGLWNEGKKWIDTGGWKLEEMEIMELESEIDG